MSNNTSTITNAGSESNELGGSLSELPMSQL